MYTSVENHFPYGMKAYIWAKPFTWCIFTVRNNHETLGGNTDHWLFEANVSAEQQGVEILGTVLARSWISTVKQSGPKGGNVFLPASN